MSLINTALQAASVLMNSQNSQWQRERENERGLTALEIEGIRQEHQLKMTYLQQELQQNAREQDRIRQAELRGGELINQADLDRAKIRDSERYLRGTWKEAHFGNEQPPYVIFCTNPLQDLNPLKEEAFRIAPFQRTYDNFKARNAAYVGRLFSTITISETFKSEAEARSFFYRELNCPCIIVYGIFTGTGFGIYALTAGMSPDQLRIDGQKVADWGLRIEKLWDISYNTIHGIKQRATDDAIKQLKKKATETGLTLPTDPELLRQKAVELRGRFDVLEGLELYTDTHVGLCVQVMLDNYFSYYPRQVYEVKTPTFLEAKQKELTRLGIWESLKTSLLERYEVLKGRQSLKIENQKNVIQNDSFIAFDPKSLTKNVNGEWICNDLNGTFIKPFTFEWGRYKSDFETSLDNQLPSFSSGALRVRDKLGKVGFISNQGKTIIPFEYDDADEMREGYASVKKSGKWGLIDCKGNVCIPFEYDSMMSPSEGFVRFASTDSSLWKEDEFRGIYKKFISRFISPSQEFEEGMKGGLMDVTGKISSIKPIFRTIKEVEKGFILVKSSNLEVGVIDVYGRIAIPFEGVEAITTLGNGCYFAKIEDHYYLFDLRNGKKIEISNERLKSELYSTFVDESIHPIESLSFNFKVIQKFDNGFTLLGLQETWSLEFYGSKPLCQFLLSDKGEIYALKYPAIVDSEGILYAALNECEYSEGIVRGKRGGHGSYQYIKATSYSENIHKSYELIEKSSCFSSAQEFSDGLAAVSNNSGEWGFINKDFELIISMQYEYVKPFSQGLSFVKKEGEYSIINKKGDVIVDSLPVSIRYFGSSYFQDECACIRIADDEEGFGITEWAIINKEGKILVM